MIPTINHGERPNRLGATITIGKAKPGKGRTESGTILDEKGYRCGIKLHSALIEVVDCYWARFFGCTSGALRSNTAQIGVHTDYAGCYLMEFGGAPIVSLPIAEVELYRAAIAQWQAGIVRMPAFVEAVFGKRVVASVGPAFVGCSDLKHFRAAFSSSTRPLTARDENAIDILRAACAVEDLENRAIRFKRFKGRSFYPPTVQSIDWPLSE
jgi:hypothetical protein